MAKTEKPFLVKLFLGLLYTVLTLALIFGGIWVFFKIKYDINLISTLSQLKVLQQEIKEEEKFAQVIVPDDQLSLAIGKSGQNARLAAKLTNWKIDIKSESQFREILAQRQNEEENSESEED